MTVEDQAFKSHAPMLRMKEIARGAEAVLSRDGDVLVKERVKKGYRIDVLDARLRTERMKMEAKLLDAARRAGVPTPIVRELGLGTLKMDFIEGQKLRDVIDAMDNKQRLAVAEQAGRCVGRLHRNGIVHGDLTTSNMILADKLYLVDFGLGTFSKSVEDRAVDLYLLHNALKSTHYKNVKEIWPSVMKGYGEEFDGAVEVLSRLKKVETRGRYARRAG